jgi:replicative DNA helicase
LSKDINDKFVAGELNHNPVDGAVLISNDVPRIKTVIELLQGGQERAFTKVKRKSCTTGNFQIDEATGGLTPGFVWVFGADTSWGKSSFLVQITDENIRKGKKVLIVSAEDDESLYGDRLLIRRAKVSADNFRKQKLTAEEKLRIAAVVAAGEDCPCFFDARGRSVEWVAAKVRDLIKEYDIDVVAFDYIQAFDGDKRHQDRRMQINHVTRTLTDVVKLSKVSGILFSQLTIVEGKPHPDKHSIRESRDVSNAAEVVLLGFTPDKALMRGDTVLVEANQKCVFADKVKNGPRGGFYHMPWNDESVCFEVTVSQETKRYQEVTGGAFDGFGDNVYDEAEDYAA